MLWYPYAQMKTMPPPIKVLGAKGVYLETEEGRLIDSVSSWWSVIHGYHHPALDEAVRSQLDRFAHVMLGGLTHEPAERLSQKLADWLPGDLDYCFFSDSGSVAVEVALKMALQFSVNRRDPRRLVLALEHAYHGDTFKTMEVGDDEDYHFAFGEKKGVLHIPTTLPALEEAFRAHGGELNCLLVEPLLQGAGGMRMYDASFLRRARELCDQYDVLLIFDEVATGFGRTGNRFVADLVLPDILCLGKALTGGYIGHAATVARKRVFDGFYGDDPALALMHGPTFMANALACSVALQSIELFETGDYRSRICVRGLRRHQRSAVAAARGRDALCAQLHLCSAGRFGGGAPRAGGGSAQARRAGQVRAGARIGQDAAPVGRRPAPGAISAFSRRAGRAADVLCMRRGGVERTLRTLF